MNPKTILKAANTTMLVTLVLFIVAVIFAYGWEQELPMMLVAILHVAQLIIAGIFKVAYVVRLVAQRELGLVLR